MLTEDYMEGYRFVAFKSGYLRRQMLRQFGSNVSWFQWDLSIPLNAATLGRSMIPAGVLVSNYDM